MTDIETQGRELVITHDGRTRRSPVPDDFSPATFRHIVAGIDLLYRRTGTVPTIDELLDSWEDFDRSAVSRAWATDELKEALKLRGIAFESKRGLSAEQLYAIQVLQDPTDRRTTKAKLEAIGIPMARYRAWMRNAVFAKAMRDQAEHNLGDSVQMALNKLVANAEAGDQRAIEKILEISGRYNPQQQEVQSARTVVLTVMEVIQEELADEPERLARILNKVRGKGQVLSITSKL